MAKRNVSWLMVLPPVIFAALAALFFFGVSRDNPDSLPSTRIGQTVPALSVTPLGEGDMVTDALLRAPGVKLVNFWASWCAPCRAEHPQLETLAGEGVTLYGINYKDEAPKAMKFLGELGNPFTAMAADGAGRTALEWGVYGVPETYVIDGTGTIVLRFAGPITVQVLERTIRPAIEKAKP